MKIRRKRFQPDLRLSITQHTCPWNVHLLENVAFVSEPGNRASLSSVCQECSREVTARLTGLNQIHKVSIVPPGCDPNDWRLRWPCSCRTGRVCLEARELQVAIPIIINYHISAAHRCPQLRKTGNLYTLSGSEHHTESQQTGSISPASYHTSCDLAARAWQVGAWTFCPFPK